MTRYFNTTKGSAMFDSSREYYDLEEVTAGLSKTLNEPVTPSMLYDYISTNKLTPYVLYSGIVYAAQYRAEFYDDKPTEVALINAPVSCRAYFKASINNIELLPHNIAPRIGYSSPLYMLDDLLTYKDSDTQAIISLKPVGYRLFSLDSEINEKSRYEVECTLKFKSRELIELTNQIIQNQAYHKLKDQLKEHQKTLKHLEAENKSLKLKLDRYDSGEASIQLLPVEKKNLINSLFKGAGIAIADYLWKMDSNKQIQKNQMVQQIKSILFNIQSPLLPKDFDVSKDSTINEWLTEVAPDYAKKGGRPKKDDDDDIILQMKK